METTPLLRIANIETLYFDRIYALHGLSMEVKEKEIFAVLGPNGAGKTTSFYMCVGLVAPDGGKILLNDNEITTEPVYRRARLGIGSGWQCAEEVS